MKKESQITSLLKFVSRNKLEYNYEAKQMFQQMGMKAMRRLASALKLKKFEVRFNAGGIAVSGDLTLHGMFDDQIGVYITINKGLFSENGFSFLYRTVKGMEDYSGGSNNYFRDIVSEKEIVETIHKLCNVNPSNLKPAKKLSERDLVRPGRSIEQMTGKKRKDYQERYDKAYEVFQKHFQFGNYFMINENSHERIHDLTLSALAFENIVSDKGFMGADEFLNTKFRFPSGNEGRISALIGCYRPEMWEVFSQVAGYAVEEF